MGNQHIQHILGIHNLCANCNIYTNTLTLFKVTREFLRDSIYTSLYMCEYINEFLINKLRSHFKNNLLTKMTCHVQRTPGTRWATSHVSKLHTMTRWGEYHLAVFFLLFRHILGA